MAQVGLKVVKLQPAEASKCVKQSWEDCLGLRVLGCKI